MYILKSIDFSATNDDVFINEQLITQNTSSIQLMEMFPESFKLIDYGTWFQWPGIIRKEHPIDIYLLI